MKVKGAALIQHSSALASYLGNEEARGALIKGILACMYVRKHTYRGQAGQGLLYMCDSAHTITLLFFTLTASKKFLAVRRLRRTLCSYRENQQFLW